MKKQNTDKTKQQFKLGEQVFIIAQKNHADCLIEGKIFSVSKPIEDSDAEVRYAVQDISNRESRRMFSFDTVFEVEYDDIFKDLETAQQKLSDMIDQNYEKAKESLASRVNAVRVNAESQTDD